MTTALLPSIRDHVPSGTKVIKPCIGNNSLIPIAVTDIEASPRSHILDVLKVCLMAGQATPFHLHPVKEKVYIHQWGDLRVLMEINGKIVSKDPQQEGPIVVPAETPHALYCPANAISGVGHTHVVASDQKANVYWES